MDEWVRWALGIVVTVLAAMFTAIFRMLAGKANKNSTDARFQEVLEQIKEQTHRMEEHTKEDRDMHRQVGQKLDSVVQSIGITNATLANLAGRFEERSRNGNGHAG